MLTLLPMEEVTGQGFTREYWSILTDPAHLAVEITITIIFDVLLLGLMVPLLQRALRRAMDRTHREIDEEHGVTHEPKHRRIE